MYVCTWVLLVFLFFHPCISLSFTCHSTDKVLLSTCIGHTKKERASAVRVCRNFACCETCTLPGWRFVGRRERGVEGGEGRGFLVVAFTCFSLYVCLWVAWCGLQRTRPVKLKKKKPESAWGSSYDKQNLNFSVPCTIDLETCSQKQFSCKRVSLINFQVMDVNEASSLAMSYLLTPPLKQAILQWLPIVVVVVVIQRAETLTQTLFEQK